MYQLFFKKNHFLKCVSGIPTSPVASSLAHYHENRSITSKNPTSLLPGQQLCANHITSLIQNHSPMTRHWRHPLGSISYQVLLSNQAIQHPYSPFPCHMLSYLRFFVSAVLSAVIFSYPLNPHLRSQLKCVLSPRKPLLPLQLG